MGELNRKKGKHNHSLTDLLKVGIFSLVMMAPFISIGVRCGYVMCNKKAKDSYTTEITKKVTQADELIRGNTYNFTVFNQTQTINTTLYVYSITSDTYPEDLTSIKRVTFSGATYNFYKSDNTLMYTMVGNNVMNLGYNFTFNYDYATNRNNLLLYNLYYTENNTLDNVFSYSVSQISNDPVFNWTRNTGIYQPINAMVSGLEIENDTLQILLTYWSLITAVYIVFDIIIFCFTKLTHFVND